MVAASAPMPDGTTATNTAEGTFRFGEITYDAPGIYEYQISEVNDGKEGYTYDSTVYTVIVTVTDEGGALKAEAKVQGAQEAVFYNSYEPLPVTLSGDASLGGTKTLEGRSLKEGEFAFELVDQDGNVVAEANNDAEGNFRFEGLTFTEPGTWFWAIREKNTGLGGVSYDESSCGVQIDIWDAGGHLEAEVSYQKEGGAHFVNSYRAQPTSVILSATKVLEGRSLQDGEFTFRLKDETGNVVDTAVNDAQGVVKFRELKLEAPGEYRYTVEEAKGEDGTVIYDETVREVTVTVTDDGNGYLVPAVNDQGSAPVFTNRVRTPEKPEEPKEPVKPQEPDDDEPEEDFVEPETLQPQETQPAAPMVTPEQPQEPGTVASAATGDDTVILPFIIAAAASAGTIAAVLLSRQSKKSSRKRRRR